MTNVEINFLAKTIFILPFYLVNTQLSPLDI